MPKRKQVSDFEESDFENHSDAGGDDSDASFSAETRKSRVKSRKSKAPIKRRRKPTEKPTVADADAVATQTNWRHASSAHIVQEVDAVRTALLAWFELTRDSRGMPWRKSFDSKNSRAQRAQRAYEVWVSEIMLQQTQVATVIPYYNRWMANATRELTRVFLFVLFFVDFRLSPTSANIEEVNALWKGLGYYSRASRLLAGAQKVVNELGGYLPDNAKDMEAKIPGIGRYSAGAICSIAYAEKVPVNPGDINQALIELGSTVCKVQNPSCSSCPLNQWCGAYQKTLNGEQQENPSALQDIEDLCTTCEPLPATFDVTMLPMKAEKKKAREEVDLVSVVEWRERLDSLERWFLVVKRPEKGLLAGLYEFPTLSNLSESDSKRATTAPTDLLSRLLASLIQGLDLAPAKMTTKKKKMEKYDDDAGLEDDDGGIRISQVISAGDVLHVFSHVKKTYRTQWVVLEGGGSSPPSLLVPKVALASDKPPAKGKRKTSVAAPAARAKGSVGEDVKWVRIANIDQENTSTGMVKTEINERYRALSLVFHPDKQQNPVKKEAAEEEYLKVQKAYQVLSDPFLRQVYDVLGLQATSLRWPENFPTQSKEKIDEELRRIKKNGFMDKQVDEEARLKTQSSATVDASALFRRGTGADPIKLWKRLTKVGVALDDFRHTFSRRISSTTFVSVESHSISGNGRGFMEYTGTVRHQFSPRLTGRELVEARQRGIQSISGLRQIFFDKRFGLSFTNILPTLSGEVGMTFFELSTRLKAGVEVGLLNSTAMAGLDWTNGDNQVSVKTHVSGGAAITTIEQVLFLFITQLRD
ncbi:hypothetical protein MD484_g1426, partial [Candolleomyces efflorescens]